MLYFEVSPKIDNKRKIHISRKTGKPILNTFDIWVSKELITAKELAKINVPKSFLMNYLKPVIYPKNSVYWFFGARYSTLQRKEV